MIEIAISSSEKYSIRYLVSLRKRQFLRYARPKNAHVRLVHCAFWDFACLDLDDFLGHYAFSYKHYLVLDFNDTLACDGLLDDAVRTKLQQLSNRFEIHGLTSDTFGTAEEQLGNSFGKLHIIPAEHQAASKDQYIQKLGAEQTAVIGNGANDYLMLKTAAIGVGIIGSEGAAALALNHADIICNRITDALDLFMHPKRITATLQS